MNEEFLLQAVGHIDEDLIVQAEAYRPARHTRSWQRPLAGLAACVVVVFALYWGADHLRMGSAGGASASAGSGEADSSTSNGDISYHGDSFVETQDFCPAIMVDGQLYWSSGEILSSVDESAILGTTTYTDSLPDQDGQANFDREGTHYARTADGIAVQMDGSWVLFTTKGP